MENIDRDEYLDCRRCLLELPSQVMDEHGICANCQIIRRT